MFNASISLVFPVRWTSHGHNGINPQPMLPPAAEPI
jgi:hypothetical protein